MEQYFPLWLVGSCLNFKPDFPSSVRKINTPMCFFSWYFYDFIFYIYIFFIPQACVSGLGSVGERGSPTPVPLWPSLSCRQSPGHAQVITVCSAVPLCRPRTWNAARHTSYPRWNPSEDNLEQIVKVLVRCPGWAGGALHELLPPRIKEEKEEFSLSLVNSYWRPGTILGTQVSGRHKTEEGHCFPSTDILVGGEEH